MIGVGFRLGLGWALASAVVGAASWASLVWLAGRAFGGRVATEEET